MFAVSALVNNLTALLLVLPLFLGLLKLAGVTARFVRWTLGPLLVACNLGGAATPIGDFPAILLLGRGAMTFGDYLSRAFPQALLAVLALVLVVNGVIRPGRDLDPRPLGARLAQRTTVALYRRLRVDWRRLVPGALALGGMLVAWTALPPAWGVGPELVAWLGTSFALLSSPRTGEELLRRKVDAEAALFLFGLFVLVGAVRETGALDRAAVALLDSGLEPTAQLVAFMLAAAVLTAVFSAGPSMAALLDVAEGLTASWPADELYVALAMSVCAGSSLFLTAATAGPLAQSLTERADLRDDAGEPIRFTFTDHLAPGVLGFLLTLGIGIAAVLVPG
jgi:Na+/H+ antiporter NhaD/arsenite permease-like protein